MPPCPSRRLGENRKTGCAIKAAEKDECEKECAGEGAFGPIEDAGGKPVAWKRWKHGEARFHQHAIEHGEYARLKHLIGDGFGMEPFRADPDGKNADDDQCDLK